MIARAAVVLALLAAGAGLAAAGDSRTAAGRTSGAASVLGGFTALVVQGVWMEADRAVIERDDARAVVLLRTLTELEPQMVSASRYAAQTIGWNLLDGHDDAAARWSLVREALGILDACVRANPGSAAARTNRGRYLALKVALEAPLADRYRRLAGRSPEAAAAEDLAAALAMDPEETESAALLVSVSRTAAAEAIQAERWEEAAAALRTALRGFDLTLEDGRRALADASLPAGDRPGIEEGLRSAEAARAVFAELLDAVGDAPRRPERLAQFRARHPDSRF